MRLANPLLFSFPASPPHPPPQDPHPALRCLCRLDAPAVLGLLREALAGWDALEAGGCTGPGGRVVVSALVSLRECFDGGNVACYGDVLMHLGGSTAQLMNRPLVPRCPLPTDLAEVCPDIASQLALGGSGRTVAQSVVDAVVVLLESGALASPLPGSPAAAAAAAGEPVAAASGETAALRFLAAHLASNRAVVSGAVLLRVLGHLAQPTAAGAACPGDMTADEREAVFCDVIAAAAGGLGPTDRQQVRSRSRRRG